MTFELTPETLAEWREDYDVSWGELLRRHDLLLDALVGAKAEAWDEGAGAVLDGGYVTKFDGTRLPNATNPYRRVPTRGGQ